MQINNTNSPNFKAKFLYSDSLKGIAEYAVEHNKFAKLNNSRKNIDSAFLRTRLKVDLTTNQKGFPELTFSRYVPKEDIIEILSMEDFQNPKFVKYTASKKMNPLKFALRMLIKLGNNAPKNNMYQNVVVKK